MQTPIKRSAADRKLIMSLEARILELEKEVFRLQSIESEQKRIKRFFKELVN